MHKWLRNVNKGKGRLVINAHLNRTTQRHFNGFSNYHT